MVAFEVLHKVICQGFLSRVPSDVKELSFDLVTYPKEAHIHGAGAFFFNCIVGNTCGGFVIAMDGRRWLFMF